MPPTATAVSITGTPQSGQDLLGVYTYSDADGDLEGVSTYRWLRDGSPIGGATTTTYAVKGADKGASLQFEVTPVAATGTSPGAPVTSTAVVVGSLVPVITGQQVVSTPEDTGLPMTLAMLLVTDLDNIYPTDFTLTVRAGVNYTLLGNTITPVLNFNGDLSVPVTVNDGDNDSNVFNVVVTVTPVNDPPVITSPVILNTPEDTSLVVSITDLEFVVFDPDNLFPDDFTLVLQSGLNYTVADNTITPNANFNGALSVPATISDLVSSTPFVLTVNVSAVNDVPVVAVPIEPQVGIEGTAFSLSLPALGVFTDADNDPLVYTASGLPASGNLVFNPNTGVFSGTPRFEDARDNNPYIITVTATDNKPGTTPAQTQFDLNISALNRANVSLNIRVAPDPAMLNDDLTWTLTASNALGPQPATNIDIKGSFVGTGIVISTGSNCTVQAAVGQVSNFSCAVGNLPVGGSASVVFTTATASAGDVVAFATASSVDPVPIDPNTDDNSQQLAVGVAEAFSNGVVQVLGRANVRAVAAGDVNGDGAADLVVGTAAGEPIQIFLSDGFRDFVASPILLPDNAENIGIALADFDRNGTLDIVVANGGGQSDIVYSNDGVGNFTQMATLGATFAKDVAVGDFNNDGIADVVFATLQGNPVYRGNGSGGFALHATLGNSASNAVAVGKFNNDELDDIVFANVFSASRVWINNNGTGFTAGSVLAIGDASSVVVGEFGGNARPDLAFGRISSSATDVAANPVLINNGSGGFAAPTILLGTSPTSDIHAGDVNGDGATDLVFVNSSGVHQIWTANGGGFDLHREQIVDTDSSVGVLTELGMTDVGNPGGVDLAMGGAVVAGLGVFLNDGFGNLGMGDAVAPVLTLTGAAAVEVPSGSIYSDAGATAADNIDGNISTSIVASSTVNTAVVGSYTVTYNVTDRAGNKATPITRTVSVTPAAGGGGGGGGATGLLWLLTLMFVASLGASDANREQKQRGPRHD